MKIITNSKQCASYKFIGGNEYDVFSYSVSGDKPYREILRDEVVEVEEFVLPCKLGLEAQLRKFKCPGCAKIVGISTPQCFKYSDRYGLREVQVSLKFTGIITGLV